MYVCDACGLEFETFYTLKNHKENFCEFNPERIKFSKPQEEAADLLQFVDELKRNQKNRRQPQKYYNDKELFDEIDSIIHDDETNWRQKPKRLPSARSDSYVQNRYNRNRDTIPNQETALRPYSSQQQQQQATIPVVNKQNDMLQQINAMKQTALQEGNTALLRKILDLEGNLYSNSFGSNMFSGSIPTIQSMYPSNPYQTNMYNPYVPYNPYQPPPSYYPPVNNPNNSNTNNNTSDQLTNTLLKLMAKQQKQMLATDKLAQQQELENKKLELRLVQKLTEQQQQQQMFDQLKNTASKSTKEFDSSFKNDRNSTKEVDEVKAQVKQFQEIQQMREVDQVRRELLETKNAMALEQMKNQQKDTENQILRSIEAVKHELQQQQITLKQNSKEKNPQLQTSQSTREMASVVDSRLVELEKLRQEIIEQKTLSAMAMERLKTDQQLDEMKRMREIDQLKNEISRKNTEFASILEALSKPANGKQNNSDSDAWKQIEALKQELMEQKLNSTLTAEQMKNETKNMELRRELELEKMKGDLKDQRTAAKLDSINDKIQSLQDEDLESKIRDLRQDFKNSSRNEDSNSRYNFYGNNTAPPLPAASNVSTTLPMQQQIQHPVYNNPTNSPLQQQFVSTQQPQPQLQPQPPLVQQQQQPIPQMPEIRQQLMSTEVAQPQEQNIQLDSAALSPIKTDDFGVAISKIIFNTEAQKLTRDKRVFVRMNVVENGQLLDFYNFPSIMSASENNFYERKLFRNLQYTVALRLLVTVVLEETDEEIYFTVLQLFKRNYFQFGKFTLQLIKGSPNPNLSELELNRLVMNDTPPLEKNSIQITLYPAEEETSSTLKLEQEPLLLPVVDFKPGNALHIYLDFARNLPDNCAASKVLLYLFDEAKETVVSQAVFYQKFDSPSYNPLFVGTEEYVFFIPSLILFLKLESFEVHLQEFQTVGWAAFKLFKYKADDEDEEGNQIVKEKKGLFAQLGNRIKEATKPKLTKLEFMEGSYALPLRRGDFDFKVNRYKDWKKFPKVPGPRLFIRVKKAPLGPKQKPKLRKDFPKDKWMTEGLLEPFKENENNYDTRLSFPMVINEELMIHQYKLREKLTSRAFLKKRGIVKSTESKTDEEIKDELNTISPNNARPDLLEIAYSSKYFSSIGFGIRLDGVVNLPKTAVFAKVIYSLYPPGTYYQKQPKGLLNELHFTMDHDFMTKVRSPDFTDDWVVKKGLPYDRNLLLVFEVKNVIVDEKKQKSVEDVGWSFVPVFYNEAKYIVHAEQYVRSGRFAAPIFTCSPSLQLLEEFAKSENINTTIQAKNKELKPISGCALYFTLIDLQLNPTMEIDDKERVALFVKQKEAEKIIKDNNSKTLREIFFKSSTKTKDKEDELEIANSTKFLTDEVNEYFVKSILAKEFQGSDLELAARKFLEKEEDKIPIITRFLGDDADMVQKGGEMKQKVQ